MLNRMYNVLLERPTGERFIFESSTINASMDSKWSIQSNPDCEVIHVYNIETLKSHNKREQELKQLNNNQLCKIASEYDCYYKITNPIYYTRKDLIESILDNEFPAMSYIDESEMVIV